MKPWIHSRNSVKKFGGTEEDYQAIHDFMESVFGNHVQIYVTREEIRVEEYDHD